MWYAAAAGFEAARNIDAPFGHRRANGLHGHSFLAKVRADLPRNWADFPGGEPDALRDRLRTCIAPLDYQLLNNVVCVPTDENIARWIRSRLDVPGVQTIGLQCTVDAGVELDRDDRVQIWRRYRFESAHHLPNVPKGHKCGRLHGHGFEVIVRAHWGAGDDIPQTDYDRLDELWASLHLQLDHAYLNDIPGLHNPTSELVAKWIWDNLIGKLPQLSSVTVYETASCGAHYDGADYRIWKDVSLDCAVRLKRAPAGDRRQAIHGHTYTLRLHLSAPLNLVMGWIVDFGDVKELFNPIFQRLDHHPLHEIDGIADSDVGSLARYIRSETATLLPSLNRIDLFSTRGCGVIFSWPEADNPLSL